MTNKFEAAKEKLVLEAQNTCVRYLLSRYGNGKLVGDPKIEITASDGPTSNSWIFNGHITCKAVAETSTGYENLNVSLAVSQDNLEVESETTLQEHIEADLAAAAEYLPTDEVIHASLDAFRLIDDGTKYFKVAHPAFGGAEIGLVGKNEYATSKDKTSLLTGIVTDAISRTASYDYQVEFTGSFVEPKVEIKAEANSCKECGEDYSPKSPFNMCPGCEKRIRDEEKTAAFVPPTEKVSDDLPLGRLTGGVEAAFQLEEQQIHASKTRLNEKVAQELHNHLYKLGYIAKIQEIDSNQIQSTEAGFAGELSAIAFVDDNGKSKVVAFPIKVKANQIELPKRPLVSELVNKAIDLNQRLSEELAKETISKMAAIDEKTKYEFDEVTAILSGGMEKVASDSDNSQFLGDTDTLTVQKHLLPDHEKLKKGDHINDGENEWEIYDTDGAQNDKNEGSASLWKLRKCAPPKSDAKEPAARMVI